VTVVVYTTDVKISPLVQVAEANIKDAAVVAAKLGADVTQIVTASDGSITVAGNGEKITEGAIKTLVIAGGVVGAHVVSGIEETDELLAVIYAKVATGTLTFEDLKSEFSITDADEVTNTTTNTTDGFLEIRWLVRTNPA
jgi:hypothetical protein